MLSYCAYWLAASRVVAYKTIKFIWDLDSDATVARHTASITKSIKQTTDKGYSIKKVTFYIEHKDKNTGLLVETTAIFRLQLIAGNHSAMVRIYDKRLICEFFDPWDDSATSGISKRSGVTVQTIAIDNPVMSDKISMVADFTKGSFAYEMRIVALIHYALVKVDPARKKEIEQNIY